MPDEPIEERRLSSLGEIGGLDCVVFRCASHKLRQHSGHRENRPHRRLQIAPSEFRGDDYQLRMPDTRCATRGIARIPDAESLRQHFIAPSLARAPILNGPSRRYIGLDSQDVPFFCVLPDTRMIESPRIYPRTEDSPEVVRRSEVRCIHECNDPLCCNHSTT